MDELQFDFLGIPVLDCFCGLGFLLLSLCYLKTNACSPVFCHQRELHHQHGRSNRRRRGRTFQGRRICQREVDEGRKLLSVLKSPLGQHYDTTHFRQLLCPDPLCEVRQQSPHLQTPPGTLTPAEDTRVRDLTLLYEQRCLFSLLQRKKCLQKKIQSKSRQHSQ
ncbi:PREDICTED: putative spermatogenesis-associated protein 31D4 [Chinchilla lanigera]|uniref:putative spermatogenesis-associated protein 31D4 n=1 Tax=Chinchilla lanigera TaxID=34839 RepID=UPI00038EC6EC|nr:PREDICTED: putative spermatogenesis-associated protein 31D4 [Chinchilla lanigera]